MYRSTQNNKYSTDESLIILLAFLTTNQIKFDRINYLSKNILLLIIKYIFLFKFIKDVSSLLKLMTKENVICSSYLYTDNLENDLIMMKLYLAFNPNQSSSHQKFSDPVDRDLSNPADPLEREFYFCFQSQQRSSLI
jgi:hypothetical protein